MRRLMLLPFLIGTAWAQVLEKVCLPEDDAGLGLSLGVDAQGRIHLSRVFRILGGLNFTVVDVDGVPANEEVARFISILGIDEVTTTDLAWEGGAPRICFYNAAQRVFEVARREPGGWIREQVAQGPGVGRWCNLVAQNGRLAVVFGGDDGVVRMARRQGPNDWAVAEIDAVAGRRVGLDGSATIVRGRVVAAHRTQDNRLRVSWEGANGAFQSEDIVDIVVGTGVDPVAVDSGGDSVWITHGLVSPPGTSDGGLMITRGQPGAFRSQQAELAELGGANGAARIGDALAVVTRYYRRNAVFGSADGLRHYPDLARRFDFENLEAHGSAEQRHTWNNLDIVSDPFGFPVIAAQDEAEPFANDRGSARVCLWRAADTDHDRIPDEAEARYGTRADDPDSDGDGRSDGEEVLDDGTNPAGGGPLDPPDDPDAGAAADAGEADLGVIDAAPGVDAAPDALAGGDAALSDAALFDAEVDASRADRGLIDGGPSDSAADGQVADRGVLDAAPAQPDAVRDAQTLDGVVFDAGGEADAAKVATAGGDDGCRQGSGGGGLASLLALLVLGRRRRS